MDLVVALEERFARTPDGAYRTATSYPRAFWDRYLSVFDRVRIACRVLDVLRIDRTSGAWMAIVSRILRCCCESRESWEASSRVRCLQHGRMASKSAEIRSMYSRLAASIIRCVRSSAGGSLASSRESAEEPRAVCT